MNDRFKERREEEAATVKAHLAALEALFTRKGEGGPTPAAPPPAMKRDSARMIKTPSKSGDARHEERERLVGKLLAAQGRAAVAKAAAEIAKAGFDVPATQDVQLQLLEHGDESCVRAAILCLSTLLDAEPPKRITVLDARLRRLEDCAEETETREHAAALRKKLAPRGRVVGK